MSSLTPQNDIVHNYLWVKRQYLRDTNDTGSLIQSQEFFHTFDGVTVSFWECNDVPMECKWEHERDRSVYYFDGMFSGACAPSLMRLHKGGRLTHVSSSVYHGSYDITLQSPQAGYATDNGDFVVSVALTITPDVGREDIQSRTTMPQTLGRIFMKFHTFPKEDAMAFFQEYPNQRELTPYNPWVIGIAADLTTRSVIDHIEQHVADAAQSAEDAHESTLRATSSADSAQRSSADAERSSDVARQNAEQSGIHALQTSADSKLATAAAQLSTENARKASDFSGNAENAARFSVKAARRSARYAWTLIASMLVMAVVLYYYSKQRCKHHQ